MTRWSRRHHEEATSLQALPAAMGNSTGVNRCWLRKVECCLLGGYRMTGVSRATCYSCFLADLLGTCQHAPMMDGADARKSPFVTEMECNLILVNFFAIYCNPRAALTFFSNEGWFGNVLAAQHIALSQLPSKLFSAEFLPNVCLWSSFTNTPFQFPNIPKLAYAACPCPGVNGEIKL